jgi:tetratricopeptide (TPR) repeat protein
VALRIRKSITVGAGVRVGGGVERTRYEVNTGNRTPPAHPPPNWTIRAKPGVKARRHERDYFKGLEELKRGEPRLALERFEAATRRDTGDRALSDELLAGLTALQVGEPSRAVPHLEAVVASDERLPDALLDKYAPQLAFDLSITPEVRALIPAGSMAAALALVECYQRIGRPEEAVGVLQQLVRIDDHRALVLSLCELLVDAKEWEEVVELTAGIANEDDVTLQMLLYRARALSELDDHATALGLYEDAVASRRRSEELLKEARYWRARENLGHGDAGLGRAELAELLAADPGFRDVASLLGDAG